MEKFNMNTNFRKILMLGSILLIGNAYAQTDTLNPHNKPNAVNSDGSVGVKTRQDPGFNSQQPSNQPQEINKEQEKITLQNSKVFGEWIFNGSFAQNNIQGFNGNYKLSMGDKIVVKLWGAIEEELRLVVDKQGNIFIPEVGPLKVIGVENSKLNSYVSGEIKKVYKNVNSYVTLDNEQPVKVYVAGFAKKPGLYAGLSSDSLLYYIDKAGGIDPTRGSFLEIAILRQNEVRKTINLYDFILSGKMEPVQFMDGDVIQILPRKSKVYVTGDVRNSFEFEFNNSIQLSDIVGYAQPESSVNKVFITRKNGKDIKTYSYDVATARQENFKLENEDEITIIQDKKLNTVAIKVEGEHESGKAIVLPIGATMKDLMGQLKFNERTDLSSVQLFRKSVKERQKESISESIRILESNILGTPSSTKNMAELRERETNMLLKLIDSARKVDPKGQVILDTSADLSQIYLEDGDVIKIAGKNSLVSVSGQVLQPTALMYQNNLSINDYIESAGGLLANADKGKILVRKSSGAMKVHESGIFGSSVQIAKGDEIMVLPRVDLKDTQWLKDITELIYQVAVGAAVILKF
jgi:protein involved in polysaccharide export with SLBB domain